MKVAVVGAGYWGPNLIRNFEKVDDVKHVVACDLVEEKLERIKHMFPGVETTTNIETVLEDKEVKAVAIATQPLSTHYELGKRVLKAKKHLFLEKPMTSTVEEGEELLKLAKDNNCIINVDHTFEYSAPVMKIKELIDSGELGDILTINMERLNLGLFQPDFNVIWDLCPHDFSILNLWTGKIPKEIQAIGSSQVGEVEDDAHIHLGYDDSLKVHIHVSWLYPQKIRKITIVGTKKMLVYDDVEPENKIIIFDKGVKYYDPKHFEASAQFGGTVYSYRHGDVVMPKINFTEPLLLECDEFITAIKNKKETRTSGKSGVDVLRLVTASIDSLESGKSVKP